MFLKITKPEGWKSLLHDHTRLADQERGYYTKVIDHTKEQKEQPRTLCDASHL